jgi:hypothetical protein
VEESSRARGIPRSFAYDCEGRLAQAPDFSPMRGFVEMLGRAYLNGKPTRGIACNRYLAGDHPRVVAKGLLMIPAGRQCSFWSSDGVL